MRTFDSREAVCDGVLGTDELYLYSHHSSRCCANDSENSIRTTMQERLPCGRRLGCCLRFWFRWIGSALG